MTATILDLFDALGYRPDERVSICHKAPGEGTPFIPRVVTIAEALAEVEAHAGYADVWWGVNPVDPIGGRGTVEDVTRWAALYADLDVKPGGMPSLEAAQAVIDELSNLLGVLPVAVTFSGHGLQPYWALDPEDPATDLTDCDHRQAAQATMRRFGRLAAAVASRLGGHVDSVFDLTRVLRAPGTVNRKGQPIPVVTSLLQGSPLTTERISEVLDEYGIAAYTDDAQTPGEMVSSPEGWTWAERSCRYAPIMIAGWQGDRPLARHPWLISQTTRLACARRLGCLTEADHRAAMSALNQRMAELLATTEPVRKLAPGELEDAHAWAVARVSAMSDSHIQRELGNHKHQRTERQPPLQSMPAGPSITDGTTGAAGGQQAPAPTPTWGRMDLSEFLNGSYKPQVPELLRRSDGGFLLYRGRVHSFHGESESGKSWAALYAAAEAMLAGEHVVMIDFESDGHTVVGRLLLLGVPREIIAELFDYRRPEVDPANLGFEQTAWLELLSHQYGVAIIDGITEALAIYGVPSKDNDEVTAWIRRVPRQVAASTGAAVVDVDHVTKDADTRGRFAIGGQAKMAALDGAAYVVEVIDPLGVGLVGRISLRVAKDRPGGVRPISGTYRKTDRTQESCVMVVDSSVTGKTTVRVEMPRSETQDTPEADRAPWRPTGYMERVSKVLENANCPMSRNAINSSLQARRDYVMQAIDFLIEDGYAAADGPTAYRSNTPTIRLIKPYRESGTTSTLEVGPEGCSDPVPGSGSNDPGTRGTTSSPGTRFPETTSEPPGNYDDPDLFDE